jgi:hypothetical protein
VALPLSPSVEWECSDGPGILVTANQLTAIGRDWVCTVEDSMGRGSASFLLDR